MEEHEIAIAEADVGTLALLKRADIELELALELIFELSNLALAVLEFFL